MKSLKIGLPFFLVVTFAFFLILPEAGFSQTSEVKKGFYVGALVGVPFAQDLSEQVAVSVMGKEQNIPAEFSVDYGIGAAVTVGNRISDYFAVELVGSWSRQSAELSASPPATLLEPLVSLATANPALGAALGSDPQSLKFVYDDGRLIALQASTSVLLYPVPGESVEPYIGGGVGIVRSDVEVGANQQTKGLVSALTGAGAQNPAIPKIPEKIDETMTDYQATLQAGINIPFDSLDISVGWNYYKTFKDGKDSNSHVAALTLKYFF